MSYLVVARSLTRQRKKYYILGEAPTQLEGDVVVLRSPLVALYDHEYMRAAGGCTAPGGGYSAGHCFGLPTEDKTGKKYILYKGTQETGRGIVVRDYYQVRRLDLPWILCILLEVFGIKCAREKVYDVTEVSLSNAVPKVIGVLSAAPALEGTPGFFADVSLGKLNPDEYIGKKVAGYSYSFKEQKLYEWTGTIDAYVEYKFLHGYDVITGVGWVVIPDNIKFIPGMSGSPMWVV